MTKETLMTILLADLNIMAVTDSVNSLLEHLLESARSYMYTEGIKTGRGTEDDPYSVEDADLLRMYTAWLYRKRATGEAMPRMLRYNLNNRLFALKVGGSDAS